MSHVKHIYICSSFVFVAKEETCWAVVHLHKDPRLLPTLSDFHTAHQHWTQCSLLSHLLGLFSLEIISQILLAKISTWEHIAWNILLTYFCEGWGRTHGIDVLASTLATNGTPLFFSIFYAEIRLC